LQVASGSRQRYPEQTRMVRVPLQFNLIDFEPRFGSELRY
jgi:hypothetical protein